LAALIDRFETCFADAASVDRASLFRTAARVVTTAGSGANVLVLLDLPLDHAAEREFAAALISSAATVVATASPGDRDAITHLQAIGGIPEGGGPHRIDDLGCLGQVLFNTEGGGR